jgi:hypothetical protein
MATAKPYIPDPLPEEDDDTYMARLESMGITLQEVRDEIDEAFPLADSDIVVAVFEDDDEV